MCPRVDYGEVNMILESTPESRPFLGDNPKTRPLSHLVVSPQSHEYNSSPGH